MSVFSWCSWSSVLRQQTFLPSVFLEEMLCVNSLSKFSVLQPSPWSGPLNRSCNSYGHTEKSSKWQVEWANRFQTKVDPPGRERKLEYVNVTAVLNPVEPNFGDQNLR